MKNDLIIIKPILTEKANSLTEKKSEYVFKVAKSANKIEIKKAIEKMYGVHVDAIRTLVAPSKTKARMTKKGILVGRKQAYKKAIAKLKEGETIDFYAEL